MATIEKTKQDIIILSGLAHIRLRYGMYIGSNQNAYHLYRELRDNANDEIMNGFATKAWFTLYKDGSLSVRDNGRGIPVNVIQTQTHGLIPSARAAVSIPNAGSHLHEQGTDSSISSGIHGVGTKTVTALSDYLNLKIWRDGKFYEDNFVYDPETNEPGVPTVKLKADGNYVAHKQTESNTPEKNYTGTQVTFKPSEDIFENASFSYKYIVEDLHRAAYLNPQATYYVSNEATGESIVLHEKDGLKAYAQKLIDEGDGTPITGIREFEGTYEFENTKNSKSKNVIVQAKIAMAWTTSNEVNEIGFTNSLYNSQGGRHIDGFNAGVSKLINNYAKALTSNKTTIEARDIRPGLVAVVSILNTEPVYSSQTKDMLIDPVSKNALTQITFKDGQMEWDKYITDIEAVIKQARIREEERKKFSDMSKIKLDSKENKAKLSKKIKPAKKLKGQPGVVSSELFITEGDSASGHLIKCRLNGKYGFYQGVMPIRGKIINSMKATSAKVFANEEAVTILSAIGAGIGDKYDESKLNYDKIIVASDSDADGDAILNLICTLIADWCPQLITNGHFYRVMAPLYANTMTNKKVINCYSEQEQSDLLNGPQGESVVKTNRYKGLGEMTVNLTTETLADPTTRRLFKFTTDDFESAYEAQDMLMGKNVEQRRKFLMENADFAHVEE